MKTKTKLSGPKLNTAILRHFWLKDMKPCDIAKKFGVTIKYVAAVLERP